MTVNGFVRFTSFQLSLARGSFRKNQIEKISPHYLNSPTISDLKIKPRLETLNDSDLPWYSLHKNYLIAALLQHTNNGKLHSNFMGT